jgi:methanogenic corrinoid protein MtbC1
MSTLNQQVSQTLDAQRNSLAEAIVAQHYALQPELEKRYGEKGRVKCMADAHYHLTYLSEAIAAAHPSLFANYVAWAKVLLTGIAIPAEDLAKNLQVVGGVLKKELPDEAATIVDEYIEEGLIQLPALPSELPSFIEETEPHAELAQQYLNTLLRGERHIASRLILETVQGGVSVKDIYIYVFQRSQYEIGRLWQMNKVSVAQEHYCTAATQLIMSQLYSYIFSTERQEHALVATCVGGDLHEIGVRMVADFFEMEGWDTYYLGANTPTPSILQELKERNADVLAISATMTFHVRAVGELIAAVRSNEAFQDVKIVVGGYPFNLESALWKQVKADAYAHNAKEAIAVVNKLITSQ